MLNNMKETMDATETLATLPTATIVAEEKCCEAYEIKSTTTTTITTTATITPTSTPTKGKSIFSWLKSATKTNETNDNSSNKADNTSVASSQTTTPTASPARVYQSTDSSLVSSYREFRGVQSLRHLWNKRISAFEATNVKSCDSNAKVKKLHKSISCLVSATTNLYESNDCGNDSDDNFGARQTTHAKRRQTRTKRAQSLLDCTQFTDQETEASEVEHEVVEINPLHREKDNFYKYKTAEQASKLWSQQVFVETKRLSAGIVSGNESCARKFPAIKTSDKGEHIHWLRRDDIVMSARRNETAESRAMQKKAAEQGDELSTTDAQTADVISKVQILQFNGEDSGSSDTLTAANSSQCDSIAIDAERRTSASSASNSKRNSVDSALSSSSARGRRYSSSTRKYSFKTHAKSYHSSRKMHNSKSDGNTSGSGTSSVSMVAQLTQQFNEIIQKDKTLLQEVKRNNGVLMSRGGHVYKIVQKNDLRPTSGINRTNSRAKDSATKALNVRRAIRKFEGGPSELSAEKPKVPTKSQQVLRKREELVSSKNRQSVGIKRKSMLGQKLQPSDKVEWQQKLDQKKLEIVKEEAKTQLEGDKRSNVKVLPQNVSSFNADENTYVSTTAGSDKSNNQNVDIKINTVNQAETLLEEDDINKGEHNKNSNDAEDNDDDADVMQNEQLVKNDVVIVVSAATNADNKIAPYQAEQRLEPEGQAADANELEQLAPQREVVATVTLVDDDVASIPFPTVNNKNDEATAAALVVERTDTVEHDDEEKLKLRKHRYAKIYEKFRFRTPFRGGQSKKSSPSRSTEKSKATVEAAEEAITATVLNANDVADAKILDALDVIDQKLKGLNEETATTSIMLCSNGDFEQRILPNSSFIYQATAKQVLDNQLIVTQAVNVALVNTIEGEQILKEEQQLVTQAKMQPIKLIEIPALSAPVENNRVVEVVADNDQLATNKTNICLDSQKIEDIYEPIAGAKEPKTEEQNPQESFLYKSCKNKPTTDASVAIETTATEDIYQTLEEINAARLLSDKTAQQLPHRVTIDLGDYESIAGSCENAPIADAAAAKPTAQFYDGYESFEPPNPDEPRLAIAAASPTLPTPSTTHVRHTTDELPAIPEPKRIPSKSPMLGIKLRPAPPKPTTPPTLKATLPTPPATRIHSHHSTHLIDDNDDQQYYADDENIYDTIKGSHCYESLQMITAQKCTQRGSPKSLDTFSISSNCYESITHYRRMLTTSTIGGGIGCMPLLLHNVGGSTSTLSSDHKTNSLYECSVAASLMSFGATANVAGVVVENNRRRRSGSVNSSIGVVGDANSNAYANSNKASSEGNSDDWVDITDNETDHVVDATVLGAEGENDNAVGTIKQQFIVVRERSKVHRSPDWSKRVRDKRLQQKKSISCIEDDSDHYYESLSPTGNKRHPTQMVQRSSSHHKRNQDLPRYALKASQRGQKHSASAHALGQGISDDYDSFDTDTDDIYEAEENLKNHNDSGVDIRNVKLPDPPSSTNQVYAMVKKLKNFISSKKSPTTSKFFGSQQKLYENSSQFYIEGNLYQDSPKTTTNTAKSANLKQSSRKTPHLSIEHDDYENTEFHTPPILTTPDANKQLSSSEKTLSLERTNTELTESSTTITPRSKSKSGKSFKSRLRKSIVGSTFDSKQLSSLLPNRSTFYVEEPHHSGSGELDSGFSEKTSTGDLTVESITVPSTTDSSTTPTAESQKFCTATRKAKKEAKAANSQRRRTIIGIRPHEPPPPPPPTEEAQLRLKQGSSSANTSWYAECGVFKNGTSLHAEHSLLNGSVSPSVGKSGSQSQLGSMSLSGGSHTSWYAEAGLYQTSDVSVASSSGSSGVSTGNEAGLGDEMPHSMFLNEPLYQIYSAAKLQSISRDMEDQGSSTDGYEEIGQYGGAGDGPSRTEKTQRTSRPTALQLVGPKSGPSRTLWSEIPEVIHSCILHTLTPRERGLQEAKFEIITSEASYLKSLNLLRSHFMNHPVFRDTNVVNARDRKALFSHIVPVHECSERLLTALESCWQDNIMLLGLSKSIYAIAEKYFHVYISFCEHQGRMDRTLRRLKESRGTFSQNLDLLESSTNCCGLNLHSFLMLPMQRITRLPLLIDAVFSKTSANDDEYENWKMTFAIMNKIVAQCNEAANRCEQAYEIERIARQLEFPTTIRALAIAPVGVAAPGAKPRFLVKKGELTHLIWRGDDAKLTFGKKFIKTTVFAFLFSDLLVLTKRRAEQQFLVFDYCPRNMLTISSGDTLPQLPTKDINQTGKNLILMTLLENHERKTVELVLSCPSVSEQERWLAAMRPPEAELPGEKLYEQWDCPQVVTTHAYETNEPDALSLEVGDVINVTRKLPDGWYQGERIRDGAIGWFPGNHTEEVNSAHVRARNLKQRYRLLTFTATYLETQKRK